MDVSAKRLPPGYEIPYLAELLHSFPRFDLSFHRVTSAFNLHSKEYKESLVIWIAVPSLVLITTLIVFLIYYIYQCCQQHTVAKKRPSSCLRWSIVLFTVLACVAIAVGFYGNREAEKGLENTTGSVSDTISTISNISTKMQELHSKVNQTMSHHMNSWTTESLHPNNIKSFTRQVQDTCSRVLVYVTDIKHYVYTTESRLWSRRLEFAEEFCYYRWLSMTLLLTVLLVLCIILLIGVARSSKCSLLLFSVFAAFSLVVCWAFTGLHLGFAIASSDFCVDPDIIFNNDSDPVHTEFVSYYVKCDHNLIRNPFIEHLQHAVADLQFVKSELAKAKNLTRLQSDPQLTSVVDAVSNDASAVLDLLMLITALVDCNRFHLNYVTGLNGLCHQALLGVMLIVLSVATIGLLFSVLILVASIASRRTYTRNQHLWHRATISSSSDAVITPDVVDLSFRQDRTDQSPDLPLIASHTTPPPAYTSEGFYRQYSDFSPNEDTTQCLGYNAYNVNTYSVTSD